MYQPKGIKKFYHQTRRFLAKNWLNLWHPTQIAITGSQGKTTTTQTLAKILSKIAPTVVTDINLDTVFNVPITALKVRPWTKYLVWELGIDKPDEMDFHLQIAKPTIAVITGIAPVHTDKEHLGSLENLIKEKRKLIEKLPSQNDGGVAILNYDDENVRNMASFTKAKVIFYGSDKKHCQYYFDKNSVKVTLNGTSFKLFSTNSNYFQSFDFAQDKSVITKLIGLHHPSNLTAVYAVLKTLLPDNSKLNSIFRTIVSKIEPFRGRMNIEKGPMGTWVLNDSLRANPESVFSGLKTLAALDYQKGRKIAILGVMGELADPEGAHQETGRQLLEYKPEITICLGDYRKYTYDTAIKLGYPKEKIYFAKNVFDAAEILKKIIKKNDLIYLKGSFLRNLKRILQILNGEEVSCKTDLCSYNESGYEK
jgi:UDP-N-acetylmuramoyl-tripeptide--D-alanyl-D-alanine ligase